MNKRHFKEALILFFIIGNGILYSQDNITNNDDSAFRDLVKQVAVKPTLLNEVKPSAFSFIPMPIGIVQIGSDDKPLTKFVLTEPYYMQATEMPQGIYEAVLGRNPSKSKGINRPVQNVSYYDVYNFLSKVNNCNCELVSNEETLKCVKECIVKKSIDKQWAFDLPTEVEWENAARGKIEEYPFGEGTKIGQYCEQKNKEAIDIASKEANKNGLYDILGNVWEWTAGWYGFYDNYDFIDPKEPKANLSGTRVVRGGSYASTARQCSPACRGRLEPNKILDAVGFRIVRRKGR